MTRAFGRTLLGALLLALMALHMSNSSPREGRFGRLVLGLLVYAVYVNMISLGHVWLIDGKVPSFMGLWWAHGALAVMALVWIQFQGRRLRS